MDSEEPSWIRLTELDRSNAPELTERIQQAELRAVENSPRSYPGYLHVPLPAFSRRWWPSFDNVVTTRRCERQLSARFPDAVTLGRILTLSHGLTGSESRGAVPSAGGLQALELYLIPLQPAWLPAGVYHFDRVRRDLAQVRPIAPPELWQDLVPSLQHVNRGALIWLIVGDSARVHSKYGHRADRFLLLEAGHLMQNLCLASASAGMSTVPLGGAYEREIQRELRLLETDVVLYCGVCGYPEPVSRR